MVISNTALRSRSSSTLRPLTWNFSVVPPSVNWPPGVTSPGTVPVWAGEWAGLAASRVAATCSGSFDPWLWPHAASVAVVKIRAASRRKIGSS
ncbi:hypothetical protein [Lentzea indica]|uniref:hypothetical protein n=1 Tax=Lentzea indica TaxID=2604800 RepID=UPI00165F60C3|nr:hypothetical protein [Lentzea indica]